MSQAKLDNREDDERFMREALELARRGAGTARPNPMVGAVIVMDGKVIGRGWHERCGQPHAEVNAFASARATGVERFSGATLYVTLEPCCHTGRTPPCADLVIDAKVSRVVCAMEDPNPLVAGKGFKALTDAGIEVTVGVLGREARALNRAFIKYITTGLPYVILKSALSLDGKIATAGGESKWISCEESRAEVHRLRAECAAVMTGIGTVLADDPLLTARVEGAQSASGTRVVVDTNLRIPISSRLVATARLGPVIVAASARAIERADGALRSKLAALEAAGVRVLPVSEREGKIDLAALTHTLGADGIDSILLEAGGTLAWGALEAGIVDRVRYYLAPTLIGGEAARGALGGKGAASLASAPRLANVETRAVGCDLAVEGDVCLPE